MYPGREGEYSADSWAGLGEEARRVPTLLFVYLSFTRKSGQSRSSLLCDLHTRLGLFLLIFLDRNSWRHPHVINTRYKPSSLHHSRWFTLLRDKAFETPHWQWVKDGSRTALAKIEFCPQFVCWRNAHWKSRRMSSHPGEQISHL